MKKDLNRKGFTLIELLAVIVIMGILLLVAIPMVSRTIENARRDTFIHTAKSYINSIKNAIAADELYTLQDGKNMPFSALLDGYYYFAIETDGDNTAADLMEQGGKSSWGNTDVSGYVVVKKTVSASGRTTYEYAITLLDIAQRGIDQLTLEKELKRSTIVTKKNGNIVGRLAPSAESYDHFNGVTLTTSGSSANCKKLDIITDDVVLG